MNEISNNKFIEYVRVRTTILEMLHERGYDISELSNNLDNMNIYEQMSVKHTKTGHVLNIYFIMEQCGKKIGVEKINNFIDKMNEEEGTHAIFIISQVLTPRAIQNVKVSIKSGLTIELFLFNDMIINIMKYSMQPKIQILTRAEKNDILNLYGCTEQNLSKILTSDPLSKYYGLKKGTVIKTISQDGSFMFQIIS